MNLCARCKRPTEEVFHYVERHPGVMAGHLGARSAPLHRACLPVPVPERSWLAETVIHFEKERRLGRHYVLPDVQFFITK